MDPNQPNQQNQNNQPLQTQQNSNNYDFIMDPTNAPRQSMLPELQSTKMRIVVFVGGIIILIILMSLFFSFLNSAGNKQKDNLLQVAQTQTEIIRVIDASDDNISEKSLKEKALTLRAVLRTSQQDFTGALGARGMNPKPNDLAKGQNPQTDTDLETALAQARHDEVLNEILINLLNQYATQLQTVFDEGNANEKELSTEAFNQIDLIFELSQSAGEEPTENSQSTE